jgi:GAF domain-containing protein
VKKIDVNEWVLKLRQIENRVDRLALLSQLSQLLNSTLDHQEIQKRAVEAAAQLMKAEAGSLVLVDEQNKTLSVEAPQKKGKRTKPLAFGMEQGIAGWVARNRKSTIVNVPKADARFCKEVDGMGVSKARNLICAPVKIRGKVKGVLEAINKKGEMGFDQEDLSLLTSLADQVGIALDNARHYEDLEEMFFHTAGSIADAIERDPAGGHTQRCAVCHHRKSPQLKPREKNG